MPSGCAVDPRKRYEFTFEQVFPQTLDAGNLRSKYDVDLHRRRHPRERQRAAAASAEVVAGGGGFGGPLAADSIPAEYRAQVGSVTVAKTVPQIKAFLEQGGTVLTIGSLTSLASHLKLLLITDALVERTANGAASGRCRRTSSTCRVRCWRGGRSCIRWRMAWDARRCVVRSQPVVPAAGRGLEGRARPVAWFATELRSGWAWGQSYLQGSIAAAEAHVGKGRLFIFGPEITFRAQPHGTFKLLFNGIDGPAVSGATAASSPTAAQ